MNLVWLSQSVPSSESANRVPKNTYFMLSLTLLCSAIFAGISMSMNVGFIHPILFLVVVFGFVFALQALKNSVWGVILTFAYTSFIGWSLGPLLNQYLHQFTNGAQLIMMALGGTGLIFLGLSAIALNPRRNFYSLAPFISVGVIVAMVLLVVGIFVHAPAFQIMLSILFSILSGAIILLETNAIIHGGEQNYLIATVNLYASILNIFLTLLQLLSLFDRR